MFLVVSVYLSMGRGSHVTITHDTLVLTIQGHPFPAPPLPAYGTLTAQGPPWNVIIKHGRLFGNLQFLLYRLLSITPSLISASEN